MLFRFIRRASSLKDNFAENPGAQPRKGCALSVEKKTVKGYNGNDTGKRSHGNERKILYYDADLLSER